MSEFSDKIQRTWMECETAVNKTLPIINDTIRQFEERERPQVIMQSIIEIEGNINMIKDNCLMNYIEQDNLSYLLRHAKNFLKINRRLSYEDISKVKQEILQMKTTQGLMNIINKIT